MATLSLVIAAPDIRADTPITLTVSGHEATGRIDLPGGIGADLRITFESVIGLNSAALDVSASLVSPLDPSLLARLPAGGQVLPPVAFPVLLRIEPSESSALSFEGVAGVELHTDNLSFVTNSPLALWSGPAGGTLQDITARVGMGSYRAGGSKGGFSDFLLVADVRPVDTIISEKLDRVQALLDQHGNEMPAAVVDELQGRLSEARAQFLAGAPLAARAEVVGFSDLVLAQSGSAIPDVWRAHDPRANVAGLLRAAAATLRFSLEKKASFP